jgi:hypothetical protein
MNPMLRWPESLDLAALAERVCRPERAQQSRAREALTGIVAPREALECAAANGLCPVDWIDSDARAFGGKPFSPRRVPHSVDTVLALVSDVPGVTTAEELAREAVVRAAAWSPLVRTNGPVYWKQARSDPRALGARSGGRPALPTMLPQFAVGQTRTDVWQRALDAIETPATAPPRLGLFARFTRALLGTTQEQRARLGSRFSAWGVALSQCGQDLALRQAIEDHQRAWAHAAFANAGLRIVDVLAQNYRGGIAEDALETPLASLPNYFEALAQLWWTGYALDYMDLAAIHLHLPSIEPLR